jgi:excisionase family DNA binding protein
MEGELLSLEDVAKRLDVPPRFVRRLVAERRITYHKVGRYVRFHERDIADYLAANRVEAMQASTVHRRAS